MDAVLIALAAFIPMLTLLVVVHEAGHFATARAFGIKVLEFGIGYPPRAFGFYAGKTPILIDTHTQFINLASLSDLHRGRLVKVSSTEDGQGNLVARRIEASQSRHGRMDNLAREESQPDNPLNNELLMHEGKVRQLNGNNLVLADMLYSLNWMPLGGFVRLAGESNPAVPRSLASKGPGTRLLVLLAGPLMNAILPILVFTIFFMIPQDVTVGNVLVTDVVSDSPAAAAGIRSGDVIAQADGRQVESREQLIQITNLNLGSEMTWIVERNGQRIQVQIIPRSDPPEGQGATGIRIDLANPRTESRSEPIWEAVPHSFVSSWELLVQLKNEVGSWIAGDRSPEFTGPIGIAQVTGEVTRDGGMVGWLVLVILFSVNLAILNILPIPMLDGGRMFFVALEWIRGKRIPPEKEGMVHLIGFAVLIGIILLISANDINRLIQGERLLSGP